MSAITSFTYENAQVRTVGTPDAPLFIAIDICEVLGFAKPRNAVAQHVDPEDLTKVEIETAGGRQTVNAVNESGLYALIFGSKLESAKRFKRWVTSEVLPAIRKTGQYQASPEYITDAEQFEIRQAVKARAKVTPVHYQTIYNELYAQFQVPSYKKLLRQDFKEALAFIAHCELEPQALPAPELPAGSVVLNEEDAQEFLYYLYCMHYLYRPALDALEKVLLAMKSPFAGAVHDLIHENNLFKIEKILRRNGYAVQDLQCYQYLIGAR